MAKQTECIGVDIGTHSIRVAQLVRGARQIEVRNLVEKPLEVEAGLKEAQRQTAVVNQLKALLKENKIKSRSAVFSIPGQTVFIRQIKLPATAPEQLRRIIEFEAREQIPFPLEKTVLEYQVFDSDDPREVIVLLVAVKREFIDNFLKQVNKTGLKTLAVSVSSIALHNFHEVNGTGPRLVGRLEPKKEKKKAAKAQAQKAESDEEGEEKKEGKKKKGRFALPSISLGRGKAKKKKKKGADAAEEGAAEAGGEDEFEDMELEEIFAEVNLGASLLDLAIPKAGPQGLIGFTRTVPVAGNAIDRRIKTKLGLESAAEARRIKEEESVVLASSFNRSAEGNVNMEASQAATGGADNIITEIRRSLEFYIAQPEGVAVDGIVLSGGQSRMRHLNEYIEEKMGIPVHYAQISNEYIRISDEQAEAVASYVIPIGLAFQGLGISQVNIDFLPEEVKNIREFKSKRGLVGMAALIVAATVSLGAMAGSKYMTDHQILADRYAQYVKDNEEQTQKIENAEQANRELASKFSAIQAAQGRRTLWLDFVLEVISRRPGAILIERLDIDPNGLVTIEGRTAQQRSITEFYNELLEEAADEEEEKGGLIKAAELVSLGAPQEDPRFDTRVFPFRMQIETFDRSGRIRSLRTASEAVTGTDDAQKQQQPRSFFSL